MSKSKTLANQQNLEGIQFDQWVPFLDEFTRENRGAHARLEIVGADTDTGYQVETENKPFDGASADVRERERTVWITFGSAPDEHIAHGVQRATVIRRLPPTESMGPVLEVEAYDGTKTILVLSKTGSYTLPPATTP